MKDLATRCVSRQIINRHLLRLRYPRQSNTVGTISGMEIRIEVTIRRRVIHFMNTLVIDKIDLIAIGKDVITHIHGIDRITGRLVF